MHDEREETSWTKRAKMAAQRLSSGVCDTLDQWLLFCLLCAWWVAMKIADQWLKFRAAIADRRGRVRVVPKRNGIVQLYTDLELIIRTGGSYGGQRAVFITELARMEDELLVLKEADAAMRQEEASRTANRRHDAVAATKRKMDEQERCDTED